MSTCWQRCANGKTTSDDTDPPPAPRPGADAGLAACSLRHAHRSTRPAGRHSGRHRQGRGASGFGARTCCIDRQASRIRCVGTCGRRWPGHRRAGRPTAPRGAGRPRIQDRQHRPLGACSPRLHHARPRSPARAHRRAVVRQSPRLRGPHDRAWQPLPLPHRRRSATPRHAHRTGAAALHRKCLQSAGHLVGQGLGHVAVHAGHREKLRPAAERLPRRPP